MSISIFVSLISIHEGVKNASWVIVEEQNLIYCVFFMLAKERWNRDHWEKAVKLNNHWSKVRQDEGIPSMRDTMATYR